MSAAGDSAPWGDARFRRLSKAAPNAQTLWLYLASGPYATVVPGVACGGRAAIAEALGWEIAAFDGCFAELVDAGIAEADWTERLIYLRQMFAARDCRPASTNVVVRWRRAFDDVPPCDLKERIERDLREALLEISFAFARAFDSGRRGLSLPKSPEQDAPLDNQQSLFVGEGSTAASSPVVAAKLNCKDDDTRGDSCSQPRLAEEAKRADRPHKKPKDPEKDLPPFPPREFFGDSELVEPSNQLNLGEPQNRRQRRLVDRWLPHAVVVFAELSDARRRVDEKLQPLRPSYESLAGIASRLAAGKSVDECRHVIAVCEADCRRDRSALRWFNAVSPFRAENFERKLGMPLELPWSSAIASSRAPPQARTQPESIHLVLARRHEE